MKGWESQSIRNKPYLAVGADEKVYATFPENGEVRVLDTKGGTAFEPFEPQGAPLAQQTVGIALGPQGGIDVADARGGVVLQYAAAR